MSKACASIRRNVDLEVGVHVRRLADVAGAELGVRAKQIVLSADPTRGALGGDSTSAEVPMIEEGHRRFSMSLQCEMEQCEMEQCEGFSTCAALEPTRGGSFSISAAAVAAGVAAAAASAAAAAVSGAECAIKVAIHEASSPVVAVMEDPVGSAKAAHSAAAVAAAGAAAVVAVAAAGASAVAAAGASGAVHDMYGRGRQLVELTTG